MSLKTRELKAVVENAEPKLEPLLLDGLHRCLAHLDTDADELDYLLKKVQ